VDDPLSVKTVPFPIEDGLTDPDTLQVATVTLSTKDDDAPPALAVRVAD
jgi:hypothetical protein